MKTWSVAKLSELKQRCAVPFEYCQNIMSVHKKTLIVATILFVCGIIFLAVPSTKIEKPSENIRARRGLQEKTNQSSGGALFTRWGRKTCPTGSTRVYEGVAGGAYYTHQGSGSDYVCLPMDPVYNSMASSASAARIYGTEYRELDNLLDKSLQYHNVPCAVCESLGRPSMIMIPGRNLCYPGWHVEYSGYLVSAYYKHVSKHQFVCLDSDPEVDQAGYRNEYGALMYRVNGICGSLPCPPYIEGEALTCVVCTK